MDGQSTLDTSDVLFQQGDWAIIRDDTPRGVMGYHLNCPIVTENHRRMSWLYNESPNCHYCHCKVPDEIQTLIHLYEW